MGICCLTQGAHTGALWQGGDICLSMADSYRCMVETNTIFKAIILQLKINKFKNNKMYERDFILKKKEKKKYSDCDSGKKDNCP